MEKLFATKIELEKEVKRLDGKNDKQDDEIKENRNNIATNDVQIGRLVAIMARVEKAITKLSDTIDKFGGWEITALVFPIIVAATVFVLFKG